MVAQRQTRILIWLKRSARAAAPPRRRHHSGMSPSLPEVGAPDPELKNSPIIDESEYGETVGSPDLELEAPACYFNGEAFTLGACVQSGAEVLECTGHGTWARKGEARP